MSRPGEKRIVAHIDMDSFYASAEIVRRPELIEEPVIIGAEPKEGKGRGVVVACNYPSRKYGVRSGMPISQAWRLCPRATYLRPDFEYYESLSGKVMRTIQDRVDVFEQVSIDEAFVELSDRFASVEDAREWVMLLKRELRANTGLTCSVGLAENKSTAKIATDLNKPDGITVVATGHAKEFLAPLPIKAIPGVGVKTELVLHNLGIKTIGDIQAMDGDLLKRHLGKTGTWLRNVANGLDHEPVAEHELKSLSTERTFDEDTNDWTLVQGVIKELCSELANRVASAHLTFRKVGIKVRFRGFETHTREMNLPSNTSAEKVLMNEALALSKEFRATNKKVRLVGIRVSDLRREATNQTTITAWIGEKNIGGEGPDLLFSS